MKRFIFSLLLLGLVNPLAGLAAGYTTGGKGIASPAFVLPDTVFVAVGREVNIWNSQLTLFPYSNPPFTFSLEASGGTTKNRSYRFTPTVAGSFTGTITVRDLGGSIAQTGAVVITAVDKTAGTVEKKVLFVGDSLIDYGGDPIPTEVDTLFSIDGGGDIVCIGTQSAGGVVFHEGHSGWTWERFTTDYQLDGGNPFWDGGRIDFQAYSTNDLGGLEPDYLVINLGGNEANNSAAAGVVLDTGAVIASATAFFDTLFSASYGFPDCRVLINLKGSGSSLPSAFGKDAAASYDPALYFSNLRALTSAYISAFDGGAYSARVDVCYSGLWVDPVNGYQVTTESISARFPTLETVGDNFQHPAPSGFNQMSDAIYSGLRRFHELDDTSTACTNLLADSWQFESANWGGVSASYTVTPGQADPWAGTSASLVVNKTATAGAYIPSSPAIVVNEDFLIVSVRVKNHNMGTANFTQMNIHDDTAGVTRMIKLQWFATPVSSTAYSGITHGVVDLGGGWYEFWATLDLQLKGIVGNSFLTRPIPNQNLAGIGNGIYMVGVQLESSATLPTAPCGTYVEKP